MKRSLISGIYDATTLSTIRDLGGRSIGFDLRGRSVNLVPFGTLKSILTKFTDIESVLLFENDKESTVFSFLNLLGEFRSRICLQFRDQMPASYYQQFETPFYWMFHPESNWQEILYLKNLKGVILPLKYQSFYQENPGLWNLIQGNGIEVLLHVETVKEMDLMMDQEGLNLSFDLTKEFENGFRSVDYEKLKKLKIWRYIHEDLAS